jgi:hypothetical protein
VLTASKDLFAWSEVSFFARGCHDFANRSQDDFRLPCQRLHEVAALRRDNVNRVLRECGEIRLQ